MIAVDATPLTRPIGGVARGLLELLRVWEAEPPREGVRLFAPKALPLGVPALDGRVCPPRPLSPRRFRRRLGRLLADHGGRILYVPWSAFPRVPIPVVATVHELPFVRWGPIEGRVRARVHRRWLERNVRECAALVVPSEATRRDVLRLHPDAASVECVPPPFDPRPWERAAAESSKADSPTLIAVGTGHGAAGRRKKGLDVLFEALGRVHVDGLRVGVVGRLDGRVPSGVDRLGPLDDAPLRRRVAEAWILVHPARSEGFGYPLLEAMAAGTPVISSDGGALPETVGEAALLVPAGDPRALAEAASRLLGDETLRRALTAAGRTRARAFSPAASAGRLLDVLRRAEGAS